MSEWTLICKLRCLNQGSEGHWNNYAEDIQYLGYDLQKIGNTIELVLTRRHCVLCVGPIIQKNIHQLNAPRNNKYLSEAI